MSVASLLLMACNPKTDNKTNTTEGDKPMSNNIAWQDQHVRFTVVCDGIIRLEYAPDGKFVDDPSFVATCRKYPKVEPVVVEDEQYISISTPRMCLKYKKGTGAFTAENLSIEESTCRPCCFTYS